MVSDATNSELSYVENFAQQQNIERCRCCQQSCVKLPACIATLSIAACHTAIEYMSFQLEFCVGTVCRNVPANGQPY